MLFLMIFFVMAHSSIEMSCGSSLGASEPLNNANQMAGNRTYLRFKNRNKSLSLSLSAKWQ